MANYYYAANNSSEADKTFVRNNGGKVLTSSENLGPLIQSALSTTGNRVYLKDGIYVCKGQVNLSTANTRLIGASMDGTILDQRDDTSSALRFEVHGDRIALEKFTAIGYCTIKYTGSNKFFRDITIDSEDRNNKGHFLRGWTQTGASNELTGTGAWMFWNCGRSPENLIHINCNVRYPTHHGFSINCSAEEKPTPLVQNVLFLNCTVYRAGSGVQDSGRSEWATGFDIPEYSEVNYLVAEGCEAIDCWQSGFHIDGLYDKGSAERYHHVVFSKCISRYNGWRSYKNGKSLDGSQPGFYTQTPHDIYASGFYVAGSHVTLYDCITDENARAGVYRKVFTAEGNGNYQFSFNDLDNNVVYQKTFNCDGGIHNHRDRKSGISLLAEDGSSSPIVNNFVSYQPRCFAFFGAVTNTNFTDFKVIEYSALNKNPFGVCFNCDWRLTQPYAEDQIDIPYSNYGTTYSNSGIKHHSSSGNEGQWRKYFLQADGTGALKGNTSFTTFNVKITGSRSLDNMFLRHQWGGTFSKPSSGLTTNYNPTEWDLNFGSTTEPEPEVQLTLVVPYITMGYVPFNVAFSLDVKGVVPETIEWDFGDGVVISGDTSINHIYTSPGWYTISVKVNGEHVGSWTNVIRVSGADYKIIPFGDFLTSGPWREGNELPAGSIPGYRKSLYDKLVAGNYQFGFNGEFTQPNYNTTEEYIYFDELNSSVPDGATSRLWYSGYLYPDSLLDSLQYTDGNIVIAQLGMEDIKLNMTDALQNNIASIVARIKEYKPNAAILLLTTPSFGTTEQKAICASTTTWIKNTAGTWSTDTNKVVAVDISTNFNDATYMDEDFFLTEDGATFVASAIYNAIRALLAQDVDYTITSWRDITQPGTYTLLNDITPREDSEIAISISCSNVVINGNGKKIVTTGSRQIGVYIDGYGGSYGNITITNLEVTNNEDSSRGVFGKSGGVKIKDCKFTNMLYGVDMWESNGVEITGCEFTGLKGINLSSCSSFLVYNNKLLTNSDPTFPSSGGMLSRGSPIEGTNIMGGEIIWGNWWGRVNNTGYSQTAIDDNKDGIADNAYVAGTYGTDYGPLVTSTSETRAPFVALYAPGNIRAVDFDKGGEGIAYHDTTIGNAYNVYRNTGVDITHSSTVNDYIVTNGMNGEWLEYTVTFEENIYAVELYACSLDEGSSVGVYVDGTLRLQLPTPTVANSTYVQPITTPTKIQITPGNHIIRLSISGNNVSIWRIRFSIATPEVRTLQPFPGYTNLPRDLDGDGLYEDVNGDGVHNFNDVTLLFNEMSWITANQPIELFDFNRNGRIDFADVVTLQDMMELGPTAAWSADIVQGQAPLVVRFTNNSFNATWFSWEVDGVEVSNARDLVYTFTATGTHDIKLTASNSTSSSVCERLNFITVLSSGSVTASFWAHDYDVTDPLTIKLVNSSTNTSTAYPIMTFIWRIYEDSSNPTQYTTTDVIHGFDMPGTYKVELIATNGESTSSMITWYNVGIDAPFVDFTATPASGEIVTGIAPFTVYFRSITSNNTTAWRWDFGDGGISTEQHPTYIYTTPGMYSVKLSATNANGTTECIKTNFAVVIGGTCEAGFTVDVVSGVAPLTVQFTNTSINAISYYWDFGDGTASLEKNPLHVYEQTGTYTVLLSIAGSSNNDSELKENLISVYSGDSDLYVNFTSSPTMGVRPLTVEFTSEVRVNDEPLQASMMVFEQQPGCVAIPRMIYEAGEVVSYDWDFGDGSEHSTDANPTHIYYDDGEYDVTLTVECDDMESYITKEKWIKVTTISEAAQFSATPTMGLAPLLVYFTDESALNPNRWFWEFGDGEISYEQHPQHIYEVPGVYQVTLSVWGRGWSDISIKVGYINISAPEWAQEYQLLYIDNISYQLLEEARRYIWPQIWNIYEIRRADADEWQYEGEGSRRAPWPILTAEHPYRAMVFDPSVDPPRYGAGFYGLRKLTVAWTKYNSPIKQAGILLHELGHEFDFGWWDPAPLFTEVSGSVHVNSSDEMIRSPGFDAYLQREFNEFYTTWWWPHKLETGWNPSITDQQIWNAWLIDRGYNDQPNLDAIYDKTRNRYNHNYAILQRIYYLYNCNLVLAARGQPLIPIERFTTTEIQYPYGEIAIERSIGVSPISVTFIAQVTNDIGATYKWKFENEPSWIDLNTPNPTHTFNNTGTYNVQCQVTAHAGLNTWTSVITKTVVIDRNTWIITFR